MFTLNPEFIKKNGKKEFVVLSYDEYKSLEEYLEDLEDLLDLRKAKKKEAKKRSISLDKVKKQFRI